jgi:hypothetical protein
MPRAELGIHGLKSWVRNWSRKLRETRSSSSQRRSERSAEEVPKGHPLCGTNVSGPQMRRGGHGEEWRPVAGYDGSIGDRPEHHQTLVRRPGGTIHHVPLAVPLMQAAQELRKRYSVMDLFPFSKRRGKEQLGIDISSAIDISMDHDQDVHGRLQGSL